MFAGFTLAHHARGRVVVAGTSADAELESFAHNPQGVIEEKIYPKVSQETLQKLVKELKNKGNKWYQSQVNTKVHSLYSHAHRKTLLQLLNAFTFKANSPEGRALLDAIAFIKQHQDIFDTYYPDATRVPTANIIPSSWKSMVFEIDDLPPKETSVASDNIDADIQTNNTEKKANTTKIHRFMRSLSLKAYGKNCVVN